VAVYAPITFGEIVIVMVIFEITTLKTGAIINNKLKVHLKLGCCQKQSSGKKMFSNVSVLGNSFFDDHAAVILSN